MQKKNEKKNSYFTYMLTGDFFFTINKSRNLVRKIDNSESDENRYYN